MGDGWTWLSLSAYSEKIQSAQMTAVIPRSRESRKNPNIVSVEFTGSRDEASLQELLDALGEYLDENLDRLLSLAGDADFQVRIGWTPLTPQECLAVPSGLLLALGRLAADLMVDTYAETDQ